MLSLISLSIIPWILLRRWLLLNLHFVVVRRGQFLAWIFISTPLQPPTPPKRWRLSGDIDVFLLSFNLAEPEKYCGASHSTTDAARKPSAIAIPLSERDKSSQRRLQRKKTTLTISQQRRKETRKNKLKQQLSFFHVSCKSADICLTLKCIKAVSFFFAWIVRWVQAHLYVNFSISFPRRAVAPQPKASALFVLSYTLEPRGCCIR